MTDIRPTRTIVEESIEGAARELVLAYADVVPFRDGETTPSVAQLRRFKAVGSATITNFLKGSPGQVITILGNGATVVDHNTNIKRDNGAAGVLATEKIYTFEYRQVSATDGIWYESAGGSASGGVPGAHTHPESDIVGLIADLATKAPLASPVFTGDPRGPTPTLGDNDTSLATTAFVQAAILAASPANDSQVWMPLTTVVGGVPELVWDANNSLIPTLVPV